MAFSAARITCVALLCGAGPVASGLADFQEGEFAEAFQDWLEAAKAGNSRAALYLGVLYDTGLGITRNQAQALDWYRRAADEGSAAAAFNVGVFYDNGIGIARDEQSAAHWYARAAARGYARADYNLAQLYEAGTGVKQDRARAIFLYREAARRGIPAARTHLAHLGAPFEGASAETPEQELQDFERAQMMLVRRSPAQNTEMASLFHRSADRHNPLAAYDLGYCYEHGLGVPRDPAQADFWYRRAAEDADSELRTIAQAGARNVEKQPK